MKIGTWNIRSLYRAGFLTAATRAEHVACMSEERGCIGSCWGNRWEGDHWGDLGIDGWIILGWISRRWDVVIWTGLAWPTIGTVGGRL